MTELDKKISEFKERQKHIMALHVEYERATNACADDLQAKIDGIKSDFEKRKAELAVDVERAKAEYKAAVKEVFGVTDGESLSIVDMAEFVRRVASAS